MVISERSVGQAGEMLQILSPEESFQKIWDLRKGEVGDATSFKTFDGLYEVTIERQGAKGSFPKLVATIDDFFTRQKFRLEITPHGIERLTVFNQVPGLDPKTGLRRLLKLDPLEKGGDLDSLVSSLTKFINRQFQSQSRE